MDLTVMHINKGNAHGTQGERSNPDNSAEHRLLKRKRVLQLSFTIMRHFIRDKRQTAANPCLNTGITQNMPRSGEMTRTRSNK